MLVPPSMEILKLSQPSVELVSCDLVSCSTINFSIKRFLENEKIGDKIKVCLLMHISQITDIFMAKTNLVDFTRRLHALSGKRDLLTLEIS